MRPEVEKSAKREPINWALGPPTVLITEAERGVYEAVEAAHRAYLDFPDHSFAALDAEPWARAIRELEGLLMLRAARRAYPQAFTPWDRP